MSTYNILILGLRRAGTTIVWQLFRQHPALTALDEPFNSKLAELPQEHRKRTRAEFIRLYQRDATQFQQAFAPIPLHEETTPGLSAAQQSYLRFLLEQSAPVVMDITRCHWKIDTLSDVVDNAIVVHLWRHPVNWVYSHLVPSDRRDVFRLRRSYDTSVIFLRRTRFDHWGMESLLRGVARAQTRHALAAEGIALPDADRPAYELLIAYWIGAFRAVERHGKTTLAGHFLSLNLEHFCANPPHHSQLDTVLQMANAPPHHFDTTSVSRSTPVPRFEDPRWVSAAQAAGATTTEIQHWFG